MAKMLTGVFVALTQNLVGYNLVKFWHNGSYRVDILKSDCGYLHACDSLHWSLLHQQFSLGHVSSLKSVG